MISKIATIQLPTLPMSEAKLDYYTNICKKNGVSLILLGEYVLNSFFKELENMPVSMIKEQSNHKLEMLKNLSKKYDITFVAPLILVKKNEFFKVTSRITPQATYFYEQNFLINYKHWNEDKFFNNEQKEINIPIFTHDGIRFSVMCGFDVHFDTLWQNIQKKRVDVVLVPCVNTFDSKQRWQELVKVRAFLNNTYILRANRIGSYKDRDSSWYFYGDSMLCSPNGEIEEKLSDKEELLICQIDSNIVTEARKNWGFRSLFQKKELF